MTLFPESRNSRAMAIPAAPAQITHRPHSRVLPAGTAESSETIHSLPELRLWNPLGVEKSQLHRTLQPLGNHQTQHSSQNARVTPPVSPLEIAQLNTQPADQLSARIPPRHT